MEPSTKSGTPLRVFGLVVVISFAADSPGRADDFWSFQQPVRPPIPEAAALGEHRDWVKTPVDAFILARLQETALAPSSRAEPATLLRRVTFDLTGLPVSPEETSAFLGDVETFGFESTYEKLVERLLASPQYGDRWAQHWLDVVRYADSDGFEYDEPRPNAWRYRDWVIDSLNDDKPYARFIEEQIAGDEIAPDDPKVLAATGLHRLGALRKNAGMQNEAKNRQEVLVEMTDAIGSAFMGLTIGCAKCHDHRFDPISQEDYYRLQAFFAATEATDVSFASPQETAAYEGQLKAWEEKQKSLNEALAEIEKPYREHLMDAKKARLPEAVRVAFSLPENKRTEAQAAAVAEASFMLSVGAAELNDVLEPENRSKRDATQAELDAHFATRPAPLPAVMAVTDKGAEAPPTFVLRRGVPGRHGAEVEPMFLTAVAFDNQPPPPRETTPSVAVEGAPRTTLRRTALARWLASENHPLTARVMVNRIWQHHFNRALVGTPNDFGLMGDLPTHPTLLEWLATEFVASGWSIKTMHRLMLKSATYQQSSRPGTPLKPSIAQGVTGMNVDPGNRLLWRMNRRRIEGEVLRDSVLAVSGALNVKRGGPGVRIPISKELAAQSYKGKWRPTPDASEHARRSIYVFVKRNLRPTLFKNFDAPDTIVSCAQRSVSTHTGQALTLLNGEFLDEQSRRFARRILQTFAEGPLVESPSEDGDDPRWRRALTLGFKLALSRTPTSEELATAKRFVARQVKFLTEDRSSTDAIEQENLIASALADYCLVLFNLNEFILIE